MTKKRFCEIFKEEDAEQYAEEAWCSYTTSNTEELLYLSEERARESAWYWRVGQFILPEDTYCGGW